MTAPPATSPAGPLPSPDQTTDTSNTLTKERSGEDENAFVDLENRLPADEHAAQDDDDESCPNGWSRLGHRDDFPGKIMTTGDAGLPELHTPHKKRSLFIFIGTTLIILDLCVLPITYYYALKFGTKLTMQEIFGIITGVYGLISFTHYTFRSIRLFWPKYAASYRPVGWTRWGTLEFLHINVAIVIFFVEVELIVGTIPEDPIVRLVAMPSATMCFYTGFLFLITSFLTQMKYHLPFNMSSTPKGSLWRPALFAWIEDAAAIEGRGGVKYRQALMRRYEMSHLFRVLVHRLSWMWGVWLIIIASATTVLIMLCSEDVGFGVGWGLPWICAAVGAIFTSYYVERSLREEKRDAWLKEPSIRASFSRSRSALRSQSRRQSRTWRRSMDARRSTDFVRKSHDIPRTRHSIDQPRSLDLRRPREWRTSHDMVHSSPDGILKVSKLPPVPPLPPKSILKQTETGHEREKMVGEEHKPRSPGVDFDDIPRSPQEFATPPTSPLKQVPEE